MVDLVVLRRSVPERFLERERHGDPGGLLRPHRGDRRGTARPGGLRRRGGAKRWRRCARSSPSSRGSCAPRWPEATPWPPWGPTAPTPCALSLEVVRLRHCPERYDYGPKYSRHDLPPEVVARLERLFYVPDIGGIADRQAEAEAWFAETVDGPGEGRDQALRPPPRRRGRRSPAAAASGENVTASPAAAREALPAPPRAEGESPVRGLPQPPPRRHPGPGRQPQEQGHDDRRAQAPHAGGADDERLQEGQVDAENATPAADPASKATRDQSARRAEPKRAVAQAASTTA